MASSMWPGVAFSTDDRAVGASPVMNAPGECVAAIQVPAPTGTAVFTKAGLGVEVRQAAAALAPWLG